MAVARSACGIPRCRDVSDRRSLIRRPQAILAFFLPWKVITIHPIIESLFETLGDLALPTVIGLDYISKRGTLAEIFSSFRGQLLFLPGGK